MKLEKLRGTHGVLIFENSAENPLVAKPLWLSFSADFSALDHNRASALKLNHSRTRETGHKSSLDGVFNDGANPVHSGDVISLDTGNYDGFSLNSAADGTFVFVSVKAPTVIAGSVNIVGASNLTLDNIIFQGTVTLTDCNNVTLSNSTFGAGIVLEGGADNQIVHDVVSGGISLSDDSTSRGPVGTVIEYNQINSVGPGIGIAGTGITGLVIRYNLINGGSDGVAVFSSAAGEISGNEVSATGNALTLAAAFTGSIDNNDFSGASVGVSYQVGGRCTFLTACTFIRAAAHKYGFVPARGFSADFDYQHRLHRPFLRTVPRNRHSCPSLVELHQRHRKRAGVATRVLT